jgi:hypothetical protein
METTPIPRDESLHDDVLGQLFMDAAADEVFWVMLKDQLVSCELRIRCLAERSFDPLVLDIRDALRNAGSAGASAQEVAQGLGCSERMGVRVIAEVLHVLERSGDVVCDDTGRFRAARTSDWSELRSSDQVFERRVRYVPRSEQVGAEIPGLNQQKLEARTIAEDLKFWEPTGGRELYDEANLAAAIKRVCIDRSHEFLPDLANNEVREESLQRSRLVSTGYRMIGCSVVKPSVLPFWILHRCYLFRSRLPGREGWNVRVYRYPRGGQQHGYTQYLERCRQASESLIDSLYASSRRISAS